VRALVTGSNGLIGSNIVRVLLEDGHEVRGLVRTTSDVRSLEGLDVEHVEGDVLDRSSLESAMRGCDVVFHTAGVFTYWDRDPRRLESVVLDGTRNALQAADSQGVGRIVLTSSSVTCGSAPRPESRDERDDLRDPDAPHYYLMKARQESEALELSQRLGLHLVAACPTVTVGGPDYRLLPSNAIIVNYLNDPFAVTFPGGCNLVHVEDVARGHVLVAEKGERGQRYLLGAENMTWAEIHRTVAELCGVRGPTWTTTLTAAYLAASAMELAARWTKKPPASTRAEAKALGRYYWYRSERAMALGYRPRSTRQALAHAVAWLMESPHVTRAMRARVRPSSEVTGAGTTVAGREWRVIAGGRA
jgi:dihydroflavonol-4-reductase